jgi:hypothetical protein
LPAVLARLNWLIVGGLSTPPGRVFNVFHVVTGIIYSLRLAEVFMQKAEGLHCAMQTWRMGKIWF